MSSSKPSKQLGSMGSTGGSTSKPKPGLLSSSALRSGQDGDSTDMRARLQMLEKDLERRQEDYIARTR